MSAEMKDITVSELKRKKQNVEHAYEYFYNNAKRWNECRVIAYKSALSQNDLNMLAIVQKPQIEVNILQAFVSRLRGEFFNQEPSIVVHAKEGDPADKEVINVVEDHMRALLLDANNNSFEYEVYTDQLTGGYSVMKIYTDYENYLSFDQCIRVKRVYDPTMCGFDPLAMRVDKSDGRFAFEFYPKTKEEFLHDYPDADLRNVKFVRQSGSGAGFNWSYKNNNEDILLLCDYYEKKRVTRTLVKLAPYQDPFTKQQEMRKTMLMSEYNDFVKKWAESGEIMQPPAIIGKRKTEEEIIVRYVFNETEILVYEETDYPGLPYIFVDGDSAMLRESVVGGVEQFTRPYIYPAIGAQRLLNFSIQTLGGEIENMMQHKLMAPKEGIPPGYADAYTNYQQASVIIYNAFRNDDPSVPLPPPSNIPRIPMPPEVNEAIKVSSSIVQNVLGVYDGAQGNIGSQLISGKAIIAGATQSNAAALPYVVNFLAGLNRLAEMTLKMIPKYYVTPRTIPVLGTDGKRSYQLINQKGGLELKYDANALDVRVEAGVNFQVQRAEALERIVKLAHSMPVFADFMNTTGLEVLVDNLEIYGQDRLKDMVPQYQKMQAQKQQQAMQSDPKILIAKNEIAKTQLKGQELQMKGQESQISNAIEMRKIQLEEAKIQAELQQTSNDNIVQLQKSQTEKTTHALDAALAIADHHRTHAREDARFAHEVAQSQKKPEIESEGEHE